MAAILGFAPRPNPPGEGKDEGQMDRDRGPTAVTRAAIQGQGFADIRLSRVSA